MVNRLARRVDETTMLVVATSIVVLALVLMASALRAEEQALALVVGGAVVLVARRYQTAAVALVFIACASFATVTYWSVGSIGPVGLVTTDVALVVLFVATVTRADNVDHLRSQAVLLATIVALPFVAVGVLSGLLQVLDGSASAMSVGVAMRVLAWYLATPLFVVAVWGDEQFRTARRVMYPLAAAATLLLVAGEASASFADAASRVLGSTLAGLPDYSGTITRLNMPASTLLPSALGLALGSYLFCPASSRGWLRLVLAVLFAVGVFATLGRGVWTSTVLALLIATLTTVVSSRKVMRLLAIIGLLVGILFLANAVLGQSSVLPRGLVDLAGVRVTTIVTGDANTRIRFVELTETVAQVQGSELSGLGVASPVGHAYGGNGTPLVYVVHNGYMNIFGRLGYLGLAAFLAFAAPVLVMAFRLLRTTIGSARAPLFGVSVGLFQGLIASWTQPTNVELTGIVTLSFCAAVIITIYVRRREQGARLLRAGVDARTP